MRRRGKRISQPRKRKAWTVKEKLEALDRLKSGMMGKSTLRGEGLERKHLKTAQDNLLDRAVFVWFTQERSDSTPISGDIIRKQAEKLKKDLNFRHSGRDASAHQGNKFKASSGWLNHFKKRHGIRQVTISGETRSADIKACDEYPLKLQEIIIEGSYAPEQIYNADETGLCYHMLPDRTLASRTKEQKAEGFKVIKERLTILFCVNKTGSHKLKPLCIGKSRSPGAFHHKNMDSLLFIYCHSKNVWMTLDIFEEWFNKYFVPAVRSHLRRQNLEPKALLLLDNCPAHSPVETLTSKDGKIKVSYLPKNTTFKIQPFNQGILATFKMNYHKALVKKIVEDNSSITDVIKKLNLLDVFNLGETAWLGITLSMIQK
uniref:HTH CENPB-type domain-containing protein n=1 Tax=Terrapene triunguis TaxID=2587831 RepID=A0A674JY10_9SAUR